MEGDGRPRAVKQHVNTWKDAEREFYAGTPTCSDVQYWLFAATRVSLGVSRTIACLDVSNAFLHAGTKDEAYAKLDLETLKLICSG